MRFVIAKGARADVSAAVAWYDARSDLAGDRFLDDLNQAFEAIGADSSRWRRLGPGDDRRIVHLDTFPYCVIFKLTENQIKILVIRHDARRPSYGIERE